MSEGTSVHQGKNEIIIVRRRSSGGDDHHGGAWKIAYADFMTAMMAFFLVMWLVNAANEETKLSVASYFNPIKLTDERPADRGIKQEGNSSLGEMTAPRSETEGEGDPGGAAKMGNPESATAAEKSEISDADYFEDPYAVLAEIALETGTQTNVSDAGEGGAATSGPATGATGGEAYRDPFDPDFWSKQIEADRQAVRESQSLQQAAAETEALKAPVKPDEAARTADAESGQAAMGPAASAEDSGTGPATAELEGKAQELKADLVEALGKGAIGKLAEGLTVTPSEGGLLISISDQLDFGMFRIGSAVPGPELVRAMDEIGKILAARNGSIAIRGFTDARPFTNGSDDNWSLSMERAHSAYFMLVRGGVSEDRIVQLSGFADRRPKDPSNPFAEVNRRIEILLEAGGG